MAIENATILMGISIISIFLFLYLSKKNRWLSGFALLICSIVYSFTDATSPYIWINVIISIPIIFSRKNLENWTKKAT